jgi:hypothetical protein
MKKKIYNLLLRSYETNLTDRETRMLKQALDESSALQEEKVRIDQLRSLLRHPKEQRFQPFFADRVLSRIRDSKGFTAVDSFFDTLLMTFRPFAVSAVILLLCLLSYTLMTDGESFLSGLSPVSEPTLEQAMDPAFAYFQE